LNILRFAPLALTAALALGCHGSSSSSSVGDSGVGIQDSSTAFDSSFPIEDSGSGETSTTPESGGSADAGDGGRVFECTVPVSPPSAGSCVPFPGDGGLQDSGELDAGVDDAGVAAITNCNPLTNAGCTGTDVCGPDQGSNFVCMPAGNPSMVSVCGDCTALSATCGVGGICLAVDPAMTHYECAQMCCTNADCGSGTCNTTLRMPALGDGVGVCVR
jgi:hypothetical protein